MSCLPPEHVVPTLYPLMLIHLVLTRTMVFWLSHTMYHGRESWPYHGVQSTMVFWQLATRHLVF